MNNWNLSIPEELYDEAGRDVALPSFYEKACLAVRECETIPETNQWKGMGDAILSYAKAVDDKRLENYAKRIKARAYRRMGELLKQYKGVNQYSEMTSTSVAEQHGISHRQQYTAGRLANVPYKKFKEQIERENPATITKLAEQGTNKRSGVLYDQKPVGFTEAMYMKGDISRLAEKMQEYDALYILGGMDDKDIEDMRKFIPIIENWIDNFVINI